MIGPNVVHRPQLQDRRVGRDRRAHHDRRRHRGLSVRLDRPAAAGPEVPGRADRARDRRRNIFREFVTIHRGTAGGGGVHDDRRSQPVHGLRARGARLPRRQPDDLRPARDAGRPRRGRGLRQRQRRVRPCISSAASARYAFIGGYSVVTKDALPFATTVGSRPVPCLRPQPDRPDAPRLRRRHADEAARAYRYLLQSKLNTTQALAQIESDPALRVPKSTYLVDVHPHRVARRHPAARRQEGRRDEDGRRRLDDA